MNGKRARSCRNETKRLGKWPDTTSYVVEYNEPITLDPGCGRKLYKDIKHLVKTRGVVRPNIAKAVLQS